MATIINLRVHENIGITRKEFLERVSTVEAIQANAESNNEEGLTIYIHSLKTFTLYRHIKEAVDKSDFSGLDDYYSQNKHFGIEISDKLFSWFKNNSVDTILRQVICWLSVRYWLEPNKREVMHEQLYSPVLEEVRKVYSTFFENENKYAPSDFEKYNLSYFDSFREYLYGQRIDDLTYEQVQEYKEYKEAQEFKKYRDEIYHLACLEYYSSLPPEILEIPSYSSQVETKKDWGFHAEFDIRIKRFYFPNDFWEDLVVKQENAYFGDYCYGASSKDFWLKWKHQFSNFNSNKNNVYSLFNQEVSKGYVYVIKQEDQHLYKIGYTQNRDISQRRSQLQTGNPDDLKVVGSFQCVGSVTEKALHSLFSEYRKTGEWFRLSPQDVKNILDPNWRISANIF